MEKHMKKLMKKRKSPVRPELIPVILLFGLLPVIAKCQAVDVYLGNYPWFPNGGKQYDFFMYWKSVVFLILVVWMLVVLTDRFVLQGYRNKDRKYFLPLLVYGGLTALSAVLSVNRTLSLKGMWQQYETVWVLLGYVVTVYYCSQIVESEKEIRILLCALLAGAALQAALGISQLAGMDFFQSEAGRTLLTLGYDASLKENLTFDFAQNEVSKVYMASYHPNYAGVYVVLVLPVIFFYTVSEKRRWKKAVGLILTGALLACLIGSGSKTGIFVCGILILASVWVLAGKKKRKGIPVCLCAAVLILGIVLYDYAADHVLQKAFLRTVQKTEQYDLEQIVLNKDFVELTYKGRTVALRPLKTSEGDTLEVLEQGNALPAYWNMEEQCFRIGDEDFQELRFDAYTKDGSCFLMMIYDGVAWNFIKEGRDDAYTYFTQYGKPDEIQRADNVLEGYERALTGRGYIWGRALPLLKNSLLWGSGPDTFIVAFPQNDYVMRANTERGMLLQIPSKAHNLYLQSALQTGVASLLCLLIFWGRYLAGEVKKNRRDPKNSLYYLRIGIFFGVCGYLLMGFLNDSVLSVAPVFWGLLGLGIAAGKCSEDFRY